MINFGAGHIIAVPKFDSAGAALTNPTPVRLGTLQDISVDLGVDMKTLYGTGRYPIAVGLGKAKSDIKAKYADLDGAVLGSLFQGRTPSAAIRSAQIDEAYSIPGSSAYTITADPPGSGTFVENLGVRFTATGQVLTRVASAPAASQYSVNESTGVYTFNSTDASKAVQISYEWTDSAGGQTFTLSNDPMGIAPSFSMILVQQYLEKRMVLKLRRCISGKLSMPFKNEDFTLHDFEAAAFVDSTDTLGYICTY